MTNFEKYLTEFTPWTITDMILEPVIRDDLCECDKCWNGWCPFSMEWAASRRLQDRIEPRVTSSCSDALMDWFNQFVDDKLEVDE